MPHEEQLPNKSAAQKLDAMDQVPDGFQFRQVAVWEQLEANLQPTPEPRAFGWWLAAAILIGLAISISVFFSQEKEPERVTVAMQPTTKTAVPAPAIIRQDTAPVKASQAKPVLKRNETPTDVAAAKSKLPDTSSAAIQVAAPLISTTPPTPAEMVKTVAVEPVAATPRSRFRIAHSNELRLPYIPSEVLNNTSKNTYSTLARHIKGPMDREDESVTEPYTPTRKPKTLIGIFNTHQ